MCTDMQLYSLGKHHVINDKLVDTRSSETRTNISTVLDPSVLPRAVVGAWDLPVLRSTVRAWDLPVLPSTAADRA